MFLRVVPRVVEHSVGLRVGDRNGGCTPAWPRFISAVGLSVLPVDPEFTDGRDLVGALS